MDNPIKDFTRNQLAQALGQTRQHRTWLSLDDIAEVIKDELSPVDIEVLIKKLQEYNG